VRAATSKALDQYETPPWVALALIPHLPVITGKVWEPAWGGGNMVAALPQAGFGVIGSDIADGVDFLHLLAAGTHALAQETGIKLHERGQDDGRENRQVKQKAVDCEGSGGGKQGDGRLPIGTKPRRAWSSPLQR
jgi:hypothetical protein